jgi:hypothetical protein
MSRRTRRERSGLVWSIRRWVRRIRRLALIASIVAAAYRWWQRRPGGGGGGGGRRRAPTGGPITPSPLRATAMPEREPARAGAGAASEVTVAAPTRTAARAAFEPSAWVAPLEGGTCPSSHPIKANASSGIFHVPGGRFYERTEAARCYADQADAAADGYRRSKA